MDKGGAGRETTVIDAGQRPASRGSEEVGGLSLRDWELILKFTEATGLVLRGLSRL